MNYEKLYEIYDGASIIISISKNTTECIKLAFPEFESKIINVRPSVDTDKFCPQRPKENIITYMPRKMQHHSGLFLHFVRRRLPSDWRVYAIDNMNEIEVAEMMKRSRIFLSFADLEGVGLPALEAAIAGNIVVGYTGEGGKEFWSRPIFEEIGSGDIVNFVNSVLLKIDLLSDPARNPDRDESYRLALQELAATYSKEKELADIANLVERIRDTAGH